MSAHRRVSLLAFALAVLPSAEGAELPSRVLSISWGAPTVGFQLKPVTGGNALTYQASPAAEVGFLARAGILGGSFHLAVPAPSESRAEKGSARFRDYRLNFYGRRIGIEANYVEYKGFFIDQQVAGSYSRLPELLDRGYGLNLIYVLSPERYSLAAGLNQTEIQDKSAGSLMLLSAVRRQTLSNGEALIPLDQQAAFGGHAGLRAATLTSAAMGAGFGYNLVPSIFFLSTFGAATFGLQQLAYELNPGSGSKSDIGLNLHLRFSAGINSPGFFSGLAFYVDSFGGSTGEIDLRNSVNGLRFFIGTRF